MHIFIIFEHTHITDDRNATHKRYIRGEQIDNLKNGNCFVFSCSFLTIPRGKHRASFDQVSEFDRGIIVVYRNCGLSFREIGQRVGRNQATVMRISHHWMRDEMTDRSHPPLCTTARDNRLIVCMSVMNRVSTSRIIARDIQSATHHSVSSPTIRRHLPQRGISTRRPLLRSPLTGNHRHVEPWT
ncbi:transposable element Tc1 transposase [Trichonephila clavipes]|nr:transposable element Tc1 transposase [Trichonephila clavipes]